MFLCRTFSESGRWEQEIKAVQNLKSMNRYLLHKFTESQIGYWLKRLRIGEASKDPHSPWNAHQYFVFSFARQGPLLSG